jgi:hypothetical protein
MVLNTAHADEVPRTPIFCKLLSSEADACGRPSDVTSSRHYAFFTIDMTWLASSVLALCWISDEY